MGLASKLAAAQAGAPAYPGGPPTAGPPGGGQQQPQGAYPGQQQYQAYPGRPGASPSRLSGAPPPSLQSGAPPPQQYQQYQSSQNPAMSGGLQPGYNAPPVPPRPQQSPQPQTDQYGRPVSPYPPAPPGNRPTSPYPPQQQPFPASPHPPQQNQFGNLHPGYGQPQQQQYNSFQPPSSPYQQTSSYGQSQGFPPPAPPGQQPYSNFGPGYGPPSGPPSSGFPPQNQPGYPGGPPQQAGYGAPPPQQVQAPQNVNAYKNLLNAVIQEKGLQNFYPPGHPVLDQIANRAAQQVSHLATNWRINVEIASDIVKLALYDVILYVDDSGSMAFEENGTRIDDLKLILSRVSFATGLFDEDGIQVRFMNSQDEGNGIKNDMQVNEMIGRTKFSGLTPMGREMQNKVLGPLVLGPARSGQLRKPVLVITITDGQPTGESPNDIANIIKNASAELARNPRYGKGALAFQFAQVGNDLKAREFLSKLDEDKTIGDVIDCTSNYEVEADEMKRASPPVDLTPDMWLIKLLLGSIDSSYDSKDEKSAGASHPPGQYGAPPGQYGAPPGQYGGPGGPGGYPGSPPQGYGNQGGYGAPQQGGYPPQGGRGYPPQGGPGGPGGPGGYPPQGGYGQAPPPPRY